jgi:prevent-host-death family protein
MRSNHAAGARLGGGGGDCAIGRNMVILVSMRKTSLADAKARLSALVDDAQYRRRKTLILRHGKPSAVIVPVDAALTTERASRRPSARELKSLFDALSAGGRRGAVADLLAGRR